MRLSRFNRASCLIVTACALFEPLCTLKAEVTLPGILSSHLVFQRNAPIHVWGWAEPGEKVSVELSGASATASADQLGRWTLYLPPRPAGGPFQMTVAGTDKIVLEDVLIGDVWFASGQSNMEMPLNGFPGSAVVNNAAQEIGGANHPNIRLFVVPEKTSDFPVHDYQASWSVCSPETAAKFSAVAYFFGRNIEEDQHVPIGLIDSTWGGTPAEAWTSMQGFASDSSLMPVFASWAQMADEQMDMARTIEAEHRADEAARKANEPLPHHPWHPNPLSWMPSALFNGMVVPALDFRIKGVIWYQGESNSGPARAPLYAKLFPAMISDWRQHWRQGDFPFLFVQIANFTPDPSENWPLVREAQRRTLSLANTAMAVTIDIGDPSNVHPSNKQEVGRRLALAARAVAYGENVQYSGPLYRELAIENNCIRVFFDHANGGLVTKGSAPGGAEVSGFEVAGQDRHFTSASARIDGETVVASSPAVPAPRYVRFGWGNAPVLDLSNKSGLPASPFTSEEVPSAH